MLQSTESLSFLLEATKQLRAGQSWPDDFQCDGASRLFLLGFVYRTHSTFAEQTGDLVVAQHRAGFERRIGAVRSGSCRPVEGWGSGFHYRAVRLVSSWVLHIESIDASSFSDVGAA
jgi:hypothetical protein